MGAGSKGSKAAAAFGLTFIAMLPSPALAGVDDVTLVSRGIGGPGNGDSSQPSISANGCRVAFVSNSTNLTGDVVTGHDHIFVRDICAGTTELVSRATGVAPSGIGNGPSTRPEISGDGRYVAFESTASNLGEPGADTQADVFLRDTALNTTVCVSVSRFNNSEGGTNPSVASVGPTVSFQSVLDANDYMSAAVDNNNANDIFSRRPTDPLGATLRSRTPSAIPTAGNAQSVASSVSDDGTKFAFESSAGDLAPDANGAPDIFVQTGIGAANVSLVSSSSAGLQGNGTSTDPEISAGGLGVAFSSTATNLEPDDTDSATDTYAKDLALGTTELISRQSGQFGDKALGGTGDPSISGNGRFILLNASDPALAEGVAPAPPDLYVRDRLNQTMFVASRASGALGQGANSPSVDPDFAAFESFLAFSSRATNLSPDDGNANSDIFRREISEPDIPVQGTNVNVRPLQGRTLIKARGARRFGELLHSSKIPVRSTITVKSGRVELTDIRQGVRESIKYYVGTFKVQQKSRGNPFLNARLTKPRCGKKKKGKKSAAAALTSLGPLALKAARGNTLFAKGKGRFRTTGFRGSATVRGTEWITTNRCDGATEFRVLVGGITIKEKGKKKPRVMTVGRTKTRHVAKPPKKK